jgi:zinc transport system substrate-binding protein
VLFYEYYPLIMRAVWRPTLLQGGGVAVIGIVLAAVCLLGCIGPEEAPENEARINVIVSVLPQADFVEHVGGEHVAVTVMVPPGASPHTYEPTASQLREVSEADIYFIVGSGVDFENAWLERIIGIHPELKVVSCADGITKHGTDPHIWTSPVNAKMMVGHICAGLVEIDPEHEPEYTANRDEYLQELDTVDTYVHERLDPATTYRAFLIYHPAFGYFAAEYNLTQIAIEHEGKTPTPQVIQDCINYAEQYNLSYIYVAPQFATKDAEVIADEIGGQTVFIDPLPRDYIANMRSIAAALALELE